MDDGGFFRRETQGDWFSEDPEEEATLQAEATEFERMEAMGSNWLELFPETKTIPLGLEELISRGVAEDVSSGNDSMASFAVHAPDGTGARIWVDSEDPQASDYHREREEGLLHRYLLTEDNGQPEDGVEPVVFYSGEDFADLLVELQRNFF